MDDLDRRILAHLQDDADPGASGLPPMSTEAVEQLVRRMDGVDWTRVFQRRRGRNDRGPEVAGVGDLLPPPFPGRALAESVDPAALSALRELVRREVTDVLGLAPGTPPARLRDWLVERLFGPPAVPEGARKTVLLMIADVVRDVSERVALGALFRTAGGNQDTFEAAALGTVTGSRIEVHHATVGDLIGDAPLDTVIVRSSAAALAVAKGSRLLDEISPVAGAAMRLFCYGGLRAAEIAPLIGHTVQGTEDLLRVAETFIHGQVATSV